jgi:hypothetical protein
MINLEGVCQYFKFFIFFIVYRILNEFLSKIFIISNIISNNSAKLNTPIPNKDAASTTGCLLKIFGVARLRSN